MKIGLSCRIVAILLLLSIFLAISEASTHNLVWRLYKAHYHKTYETRDEEVKRQSIFYENVGKILDHNKRYRQGVMTWEMGLNQFADWTQREFHEWLTGEN